MNKPVQTKLLNYSMQTDVYTRVILGDLNSKSQLTSAMFSSIIP
ncbi:hypothetical protein QE417_001076 [Mucilaginibacter terrae]|uniref:Uncharacterized protein n=1 Tax=Mucilaginibacter terrae TaxID=1955052 RepID=A0ABU3GQE1_9SPHI|nr:hypothetical protein [Mucilaginibacter terrae]